jgi:ribosome biogenesis protein BMS1
VGGVLVDKDAVYIDVKTSTFDPNAEYIEDRGLGEQLMLGLQGERKLLGESGAGVRLFQGGGQLVSAEDDRSERFGGRSDHRKARFLEREARDDDEDEGFESGEGSESENQEDGDDLIEATGQPGFLAKNERKSDGQAGEIAFAESDSDLGSVSSVGNQELEEASDEDSEGEDDGGLRWKEDMVETAKRLHTVKTAYRATDLSRMLYDESISPADVVRQWKGHVLPDEVESEGEEMDDFFQKRGGGKEEDLDDRLTPRYDYQQLSQKWQDAEMIESIRHRFTKASLASGANGVGEDGDDEEDGENEGQSDEGDGEFEDLEADETMTENVPPASDEANLDAERARNAKRKEELKLRFEEEDREEQNRWTRRTVR